jgi:hypothetical protein
MQHLMMDCAIARDVWTVVCRPLGKPEWTPAGNQALSEWCQDKIGTGRHKKDVRAIIILVLLELWKHRNSIVFDGATPFRDRLLARVQEEGRSWKLTGLLRGEVGAFLGALTSGPSRIDTT